MLQIPLKDSFYLIDLHLGLSLNIRGKGLSTHLITFKQTHSPVKPKTLKAQSHNTHL
jgi:hypothetical protein